MTNKVKWSSTILMVQLLSALLLSIIAQRFPLADRQFEGLTVSSSNTSSECTAIQLADFLNDQSKSSVASFALSESDEEGEEERWDLSSGDLDSSLGGHLSYPKQLIAKHASFFFSHKEIRLGVPLYVLFHSWKNHLI